LASKTPNQKQQNAVITACRAKIKPAGLESLILFRSIFTNPGLLGNWQNQSFFESNAQIFSGLIPF